MLNRWTTVQFENVTEVFLMKLLNRILALFAFNKVFLIFRFYI